MENIVKTITDEELSLDELGDIVKASLSKIYSKLKYEEGMYNPVGIIKSLGEDLYDIEIIFINGQSHNSGGDYEHVWFIS